MTNQIIYKYANLDINTISNLINERIYFNRIDNFDDPTDAAFIILTGSEGADRSNLSDVSMQKLYNFMGVKYTNPGQAPEEKLIQVCYQLERALKKYIGISCFSQHMVCSICQFPQLNPLMLTHYSNRHTGIVIEYQCTNPKILKKVNYSAEYKIFNYAGILNNLTFKKYPTKHIKTNDKVIGPLCFKFKEWIYQDECRIFSSPNVSRHYSELGLKINRIFFGSRIDKYIADAIIKILANRDIHFFYLRTPIINNDQQRVIICDAWGGSTRKSCHIKCK